MFFTGLSRDVAPVVDEAPRYVEVRVFPAAGCLLQDHALI